MKNTQRAVTLAMVLLAMLTVILLSVLHSKDERESYTPALTPVQALALHDLSIENDCRRQANLSTECRQALDRLDFMRALKAAR